MKKRNPFQWTACSFCSPVCRGGLRGLLQHLAHKSNRVDLKHARIVGGRLPERSAP